RIHSNNMYIELAVGGGIVVFAAFVWLMRSAAGCATTLLAAARSRVAAGVAAAMLAIALHGVVDSFLSFAPTYILFALVLGCASAASENAGSGMSRTRQGTAHANRV
ncbi:MAG TPA: hypothetical protein VGY57_13635, partial [Vicinamibacterales bacterium]|nr:hypothetical protein [Vicinamibacterales bacterium]